MSSSCVRKGGSGDTKDYGLRELEGDACGGLGGRSVGGTSGASAERADYEKGYQAGEEAGYAFGEKKARLLLERLQGIVDGLETFKADVLREMEPQLVALSIEIARKVIHREIETGRNFILEIARDALKSLPDWQEVVIHLHPGDLEALSGREGELNPGSRSVRFEGDDSVPVGGCVVRENHGEIDGRTEEQLDEISATLLGSDESGKG